MTGTVRASSIDVEALDDHRRELTGYCYRMLGGTGEAEDAVQETMVRAWRRADAFAAYKPVATGEPAATGDVRSAWAIQVIDVRNGRIAGHHHFIGPAHFERFGLPLRLGPDDAQAP